MKIVMNLVLALAVSSVSVSAHAGRPKTLPGTSLAIVTEAKLDVKVARGVFKNLREARLVGRYDPIVDSYRFDLEANNEILKFRVVSVRDAGCGSKLFVAFLFPDSLSDRTSGVLQVVDHSKRVCTDVIPATWLVTVELERVLANNTSRKIGTLKALGNPL